MHFQQITIANSCQYSNTVNLPTSYSPQFLLLTSSRTITGLILIMVNEEDVEIDNMAWGALVLGGRIAESVVVFSTFHCCLRSNGSMAPRDGDFVTPLGNLCTRDDLLDLFDFENMFGYLLGLDNSFDVVGSAIFSLITTTFELSLQERRLELINKLFDSNPEAIKYIANGRNLLHTVCSGTVEDKTFRNSVFLSVLNFHPEALMERTTVVEGEDGDLPIHLAAENEDFDFVKKLLQANMDAGTMLSSNGSNILHSITMGNRYGAPKFAGFLIENFPTFVTSMDRSGITPLHAALLNSLPNCDLIETLYCANTETISQRCVWAECGLPLHILINTCESFSDVSTRTSGFSRIFRAFLRFFPDGVRLQSGSSERLRTPYELAVEKQLDPYYIRLLLMTLVSLPNRNEEDNIMHMRAVLSSLNHEARKGALLFLALIRKNNIVKSNSVVCLELVCKDSNQDLLRNVMSFI